MTQPSDALLDAICMVESHGKARAYNAKTKAAGAFQITPGALAQVNKTYRTRFSVADCYDKHVGRNIARLYLTYLARQYERQTGNRPGQQELARFYNGGLGGWQGIGPGLYWRKVAAAMMAKVARKAYRKSRRKGVA